MAGETIHARRLPQRAMNSPAGQANALALLASVVGLLVFALLPFVAFDPGAGMAQRQYTGLAALSALSDAAADLPPEALDALNLQAAGDGAAPLLVPIPVLLLLATGASLGALLRPGAATVLRWLALVGGGGIASLLLVWALSSDYSPYAQAAYWLLVALGWFIAAQSFVPRRPATDNRPRLGDAPQQDEAPLTPAPLGIEPTMTFSMPTPAGFSAARPLGNLRPAVAWLVESRSGRRHPVYEGNTAIGRSQSNDVVLDDPRVSREHALIREEAGTFTLYDRASAHGTIVNNHRLDGPVRLQNRVQIKLGGIVLQFVQLDEAPAEGSAS